MGDQSLLYRFDLPYPSFELPTYLESNTSVEETVAGIIQPHGPLHDYPHFPFTVHSGEEEEGRCIALREFVRNSVEKLLDQECEAIGREGRYPAAFVVSAVVDVLKTEVQANLLTLLNRSIACYDPERIYWSDRFEDYALLIEEAKRHPEKQLAEKGSTVLDYPDSQDRLVIASKLIDLRKLPPEQIIDANGLIQAEFKSWFEFQRDLVRRILQTTNLWEEPYFECGKLIRNRIPAHYLKALFPVEKRADKRMEKMRATHRLVMEDFLQYPGIGKKDYIRQYYPKLKPRRELRAFTPTDKTLNRWLEAGNIKKWQQDHSE